jgi:hypothetical protein
VRSEIVEDDDVAGFEGGREFLFDIDEETLAVDRAVEQGRRVDAVAAQRRQERRRLLKANAKRSSGNGRA